MTRNSFALGMSYELALVIVVIIASVAGFHADSIVAFIMDATDFG